MTDSRTIEEMRWAAFDELSAAKIAVADVGMLAREAGDPTQAEALKRVALAVNEAQIALLAATREMHEVIDYPEDEEPNPYHGTYSEE